MSTINQNYLPKADNTNPDLSNFDQSIIHDDGTHVGIGTTGPGYTLDVNGDIGFSGKLWGAITGSNLQIYFHQTANNPYWMCLSNNSDTGRFFAGVEGSAGATFSGSAANAAFAGSNADHPFHILSKGEIKATFDTSGNVGIGTTDPAGGITLYGTNKQMLEIRGGAIIGNGSSARSVIVAPPPTGTADDDRRNIQNAVDALPANGGKVILQQGNYVVNQNGANGYAILLPDGVQLVGSSMIGTEIQIQAGVSNIHVFRLGAPRNNRAHTTASITNLHINNINACTGIIGINAGNYSATTGTSAQPILIEDVRITGCDTAIRVSSWFCMIRNCYLRDCLNYGIKLEHKYGSTGALTEATDCCGIYHCNIWGNSSGIQNAGIYVRGHNNNIVNCHIGGIANSATAYGIHIDKTTGAEETRGFANYVCGNYIHIPNDSSEAAGIRVESRGNTLIGNYFEMPDVGRDFELTDDALLTNSGNMIMGNFRDYRYLEGSVINNLLAGRIGIGSTSPEYNLEVSGTKTIDRPTFSGTGKKDLAVGGDFTGTSNVDYQVKISERLNGNIATIRKHPTSGYIRVTTSAAHGLAGGEEVTLTGTSPFHYNNSRDTITFINTTTFDMLNIVWTDDENAGQWEKTNLFQWNDGSGWSASISIGADSTNLSNGVKVRFASRIGHVVNDIWSFSAHPVEPLKIMSFGGNDLLVAKNSGEVGIGVTSPAAKLHCRNSVGAATGKQLIADFEVFGNSANTHLLLYGNGNDNTANWINTSGGEKLILGDGNNPDTLAVTGGNVGVGTTSPAASAKLELSSTTGALLLTRMTTTQRNALTAVAGMVIFNTTTGTFQGCTVGGGTPTWVNL